MLLLCGMVFDTAFAPLIPDYLFHSDDFSVAELKILDFIGSDHFPLMIELRYEPVVEPIQEAPELDVGDKEDADQAVDTV